MATRNTSSKNSALKQASQDAENRSLTATQERARIKHILLMSKYEKEDVKRTGWNKTVVK